MITGNTNLSPSVRHFRELLPWGNRIQYLVWRLSGAKGIFRCRLRDGTQLSIRPRPSNDYDTAYEIFFERIYHSDIDPHSVHRIVDLGGNVGFSCLYWCRNYPDASVVVFEPHPFHCSLLDRHLEENGYAGRVTLVRAGAATDSGHASLTDHDDASTVVKSAASNPGNRNLLEIELVDVFELVGQAQIDILKIDIEGAEYDILADPRFDGVAARTRCIFLEWHHREPHHRGAAWCSERLTNLGFTLKAGRSQGEFGILIGTREISSS